MPDGESMPCVWEHLDPEKLRTDGVLEHGHAVRDWGERVLRAEDRKHGNPDSFERVPWVVVHQGADEPPLRLVRGKHRKRKRLERLRCADARDLLTCLGEGDPGA